MELAISIACTLGALAVLILVRNEATFLLRSKALRRVSELSHAAIDRHEPWEIYYDMFNARTYNGVLFDLRLWSAEKAYPELFKQAA